MFAQINRQCSLVSICLENAELTQESEIFFFFQLQDFSEPLLYHLVIECVLRNESVWDNCAAQYT